MEGTETAMRINKIERNYIIFWGIVEIVAMFPFYYTIWRMHRGWPSKAERRWRRKEQ